MSTIRVKSFGAKREKRNKSFVSMNSVEPSVFVRVAGGIISGTGLVVLLGWGAVSIYISANKNKVKKLLQDSKKKTK